MIENQNAGNVPKSSERLWAVSIYLSSLFAFLLPFSNIVIPLILWKIKKDESDFVDQQGKEVINFQITYSIISLVAILCLPFFKGDLHLGLLGLGILVCAFVIITVLGSTILGVIAVSGGKSNIMPMKYDFLK